MPPVPFVPWGGPVTVPGDKLRAGLQRGPWRLRVAQGWARLPVCL